MVLLSLALGTALAGMVALAGTAQQAEAAASKEKFVFASERTTGTGVNNPTGDLEIFRMNPDGTGVRQLTTNKADDFGPTLSPGGKKIAYQSYGVQPSNLDGDSEVYRMNALDGSAKKNLFNNGVEIAGASPVNDYDPDFSPTGDKIVYESTGKQASNLEGDSEIYRMNTLDGLSKKNLSNNGSGVDEFFADWGRQAM